MAALLDFDSQRQSRAIAGQRHLHRAGQLPGFSCGTWGKHFSVNLMVAKESVRARNGRPRGRHQLNNGIQLHAASGLRFLRGWPATTVAGELQIGGLALAGQHHRGHRICAGRNMSQAGFTASRSRSSPTPTAANSARAWPGAVWADAGKTSVYRFYQFWIRIGRPRRRPLSEILHLSQPRRNCGPRTAARRPGGPKARDAHKALAQGDDRSGSRNRRHPHEAMRASEILFGGGLEGISESTFLTTLLAKSRPRRGGNREGAG